MALFSTAASRPEGRLAAAVARLAFLIMLACMFHGPAHADGPWSGEWKVTWPHGGAYLSLTEEDGKVRGSFGNGRGEVEATANGASLEGLIIHDETREGFSATLSPDRKGFSGSTSAGEWLSGLRQRADSSLRAELLSPRDAMRSFLTAGNRARDGDPQALAWAVAAVDFGEAPELVSQNAKYAATERLYDLVDLATFSLAEVPHASTSPRLSLTLPRLDGAAGITLDMARDADGKWRIVMPPAEARAKMADGGSPRPADAFRDLQSPRDTFRSFLEGMAEWREGGDLKAVSTLDLSEVPDVLKLEQGQLVAQYLVRIIDRVGHMPLQSIPNSGASREPFVYFEHPEGRIVIAPMGTGADTRWRFSAATVHNVRRLFAAVQALPENHFLDKDDIPFSPMFAMRAMVQAYAPVLLRDILGRGRGEYWQLIAGLLLLTAVIFTAWGLQRSFRWLLLRPVLRAHVVQPRRFALAAGLVIAFAIGARLSPLIGLPLESRQYGVPVIGTGLLLLLAYAGWQLIGILSSFFEDYTERTASSVDNILLTFLRGLARLSLLGAAGLWLGHLWSVPTAGLLAGLGIGGFAVAFASKETLANLLGAGILLGDRPFRKGDRIIAGDVNGWVEAVGLRSTRVRTLYDSLLIVPNGKLADATIDNLGAIRRRALSATFPVTGGCTPERLQNFTAAIAARISSDPLFDGANSEVNVTGIAENGIQIEISTSLKTRHGRDSRAATHRLYLDILQLAAAEGLTLGRGMKRKYV